MTSKVGICNKALIKIGAETIASLTEGSENANTLSAVYDAVRDAELRKHPWNFAIKRKQIAEDAEAPEFGYETQYTMPTDLLRILPGNARTIDWKIEGRKIVTNSTGALNIRYIARVDDPELYDGAFVDTLACALAVEICERRTQSNQKAVMVREDYKSSIREAKRVNAFENLSEDMPVDDWLAARL